MAQKNKQPKESLEELGKDIVLQIKGMKNPSITIPIRALSNINYKNIPEELEYHAKGGSIFYLGISENKYYWKKRKEKLKRFFGIKLGTKDVIKMADDIYMHLPDKFQVDADFNESKKTEKAGRFAVPLAQVRLSSSEYTPLRSACILVKLSETGLAPEYDKLSSLTQIQKRTFLARIAQNQKIMADMLIKNPDEQKKTYGQTMLDEAKEMSEKALQTVSENVEK